MSGSVKGRTKRAVVRGAVLLAALMATLSLAMAAGAQGTASGAPPANPGAQIEDLVKEITLYLARFVEVTAAAVIGIASLRALGKYFIDLAHPVTRAMPSEEIRLSLGRSLALALEFELGADILKTAVAPTWNDIGQLAAIAVLRTALNYFLGRELAQAQQQEQVPPDTGKPIPTTVP